MDMAAKPCVALVSLVFSSSLEHVLDDTGLNGSLTIFTNTDKFEHLWEGRSSGRKKDIILNLFIHPVVYTGIIPNPLSEKNPTKHGIRDLVTSGSLENQCHSNSSLKI